MTVPYCYTVIFSGDLERSEFHVDPPPILDRHASLSAVQIGFIDNICRYGNDILHDRWDPILTLTCD